MRAFVATILLGVALTGVHGIDNLGTCGTKWDDFTSYLGEMMLMKLKNKVTSKFRSCFDIKPSQEFINDSMPCIDQFMTNLNDTLCNKGRPPTMNEIKQWHEDTLVCKMSNIGAIDSSGNRIDKNKLKQYLNFGQWTTVEEDKLILTNLSNNCIDQSSGNTVAQQAVAIERCMVEGLLQSCMKKGRSPPGMMLPVYKAFFTLWEEPKCPRLVMPASLKDIATKCWNNAKKKWDDDGLAAFGSESMNMYKDCDVKNAMYFLKLFGKTLMQTCKCSHENIGFINTTAGALDFSALKDYVTNPQFWINDEQRMKVGDAFDECVDDEYEEPEVAQMMSMGGMERQMHMMKDVMEFKKCFAPKIIQICGLNNDVLKFFVPALDPELYGMIHKHFMEENGKQAVETVIGVVKNYVYNMMTMKDM